MNVKSNFYYLLGIWIPAGFMMVVASLEILDGIRETHFFGIGVIVVTFLSIFALKRYIQRQIDLALKSPSPDLLMAIFVGHKKIKIQTPMSSPLVHSHSVIAFMENMNWLVESFKVSI